MKKVLAIFSIIIISFFIVACSNRGKSSKAIISIGESNKFRDNEINEAINCVKEKFVDFKGCELTHIWYDEEKSDFYMRGAISSHGDTIMLLSNFKVDSSGGDGSFNPNTTYTEWKGILLRDSKTGKWEIDDWGY